jgi:hypothetical protein
MNRVGFNRMVLFSGAAAIDIVVMSAHALAERQADKPNKIIRRYLLASAPKWPAEAPADYTFPIEPILPLQRVRKSAAVLLDLVQGLLK